jgi:mRNA interferase RelE/StbE
MTIIGHNMTSVYAIEYKRAATRYLQRLAAPERERILDAIESLAEDPMGLQLDTRKLRKRPVHRLRVGPYRILYERHDDLFVIVVVAVRP